MRLYSYYSEGIYIYSWEMMRPYSYCIMGLSQFNSWEIWIISWENGNSWENIAGIITSKNILNI